MPEALMQTRRLTCPNWPTLDVETKRYARRARRRAEILNTLTIVALIGGCSSLGVRVKLVLGGAFAPSRAAPETEAQPSPRAVNRATSVRLRCSTLERCRFHRDGGPELEKCPGVCDATGCTLDGYYEIGAERLMCAAHAGIVLLARAVAEALATDNDVPG